MWRGVVIKLRYFRNSDFCLYFYWLKIVRRKILFSPSLSGSDKKILHRKSLSDLILYRKDVFSVPSMEILIDLGQFSGGKWCKFNTVNFLNLSIQCQWLQWIFQLVFAQFSFTYARFSFGFLRIFLQFRWISSFGEFRI